MGFNMNIYKTFLIIFLSFFLHVQEGNSVFGYLKRGGKHCTGTCNKRSICSLENDKKFRWCLKHCSHKMKPKRFCESFLPFKMRPFLPYESLSGPFSTNNISPIGLAGLDIEFIKQTTDKRRLIGTAKLLLLVHAQYVKGKNVQKLSEKKRSKLAEKLLRKFFKNDPLILKGYDKKKSMPNGTVAVLFDNLKRSIMAKYRKKNP